MKKVVILAALVAVAAAAPAYAQSAKRNAETASAMTRHDAGGPLKQGNQCWVYTDARGAGFWDACDPISKTPRGLSLRGRSETEISAIENGSGGGGDGGGGGGGR